MTQRTLGCYNKVLIIYKLVFPDKNPDISVWLMSFLCLEDGIFPMISNTYLALPDLLKTAETVINVHLLH